MTRIAHSIQWDNDEVIATPVLPKQLTNEWDVALAEDRQHLRFAYRDPEEFKQVELKPSVSRDIWQRFLELGGEGSTPEDVLKYARDYGRLDLCLAHSLPSSHPLDGVFSNFYGECDDISNTEILSDGLFHLESIAVWQLYAREAKALVSIAYSLHGGIAGDAGDWNVLRRRYSPHVEYWENRRGLEPSTIGIERQSIALIMNKWIWNARLIPALTWSLDKQPNLVIESSGETVFGVLTTMLLLAVSLKSGFAFCANCGREFKLGPGQSPFSRVFCKWKNCGPKAGRRFASRDNRLRNRLDPDRKRRTNAERTLQMKKKIKRELAKIVGPLRPDILRLSKMYNISVSTLYQVHQNKLWKEVTQ